MIAQCLSNHLSYKWCGYCRNSGHTMAEHNATHCCWVYPTIQCDCPTSCFNCRAHKLDTKGHYAFNNTCPLKKNMRQHTSAPVAASTPAIAPLTTPTAPPPSTL